MLVYIVSLLLLVEIGRRYKQYQHNKKLLPTGIPVHHQFLPVYSIFSDLFVFRPLKLVLPDSLITSWFGYHRNNVHSELIPKMMSGNAKIIGIASSQAAQILVRDPDLIKEIAVTKKEIFVKPVWMYSSVNIFGVSILTAEGEHWKRHREICNPAFSERNLQLVAKSTCDAVHQMFQSWDSKMYKGEANIDVEPYVSSVTMAIISESGFGIKLNKLFSEKTSQDSQVNEIMHNVTNNLLYYVIIPNWLYALPIRKLRSVKGAFDALENKLKSIIEEAKNKEIVEKRKADLVTLLATSQTEEADLTPREILSDAFIFMFAGHETTAVTLSFCFRLIALNPHIQEKIFEEVTEIVGLDRDIEYSDYQNLIYCRAVIRETLRMHPPVISIPKYCAEDTDIGEFHIKKGVTTYLSAQHTHMNPNVWENPSEFNPDRFDTRINTKRNFYSWIPFSVGPRSCIGLKVAQVEATLVLAMVVRKYLLSIPEEEKKIPFETYSFITTKPKRNVIVTVKPRQ